MPKTSYTVFISSTYIDNVERRKIVEDAVINAGMLPVGMERFTASDRPTVEECERLAQESDVYVGIVAHRYGWIPVDEELSITELEYDAAKKAGRSCFMFHIDPSLPVVPDKDFDKEEEEGPDRWDKQRLLKAFKAKYLRDQMPAAPFTNDTLGAKVLQALYEWRDREEGRQVEATHEAPEQAQTVEEIARYRQAIESHHALLNLAGFKTRLRVPLDLEELYVPLNAMVDLRAVGEAGFADATDAEQTLRKAEAAREIPLIGAFREVQQRNRRGLVILGDPGSGKTTHLKRLLLWCLRKGPEELGLDADLLPVFLPLRELEDLSQGLEAFIQQQLDSPHLSMGEGFGERLLKRGKLLLLFDGLDEVSDPWQRAEVAHWIEKATNARPDCRPVVTCRFAGYDNDTRLNEQFLELHLRPLTRDQSETFIRNWYQAVETGLAQEPAQGEVKARTRADELIETLRQPDFRAARMVEMTRNPLLLANLCLVHRDRGTLPKGRARLYDECVDVLLELWRGEKKLPLKVTAKDGRRILQPAALWLHGKEGRIRASAEELAPILEKPLKSVRWQGGDAKTFLRTVRDQSGLLTGWGQDDYGFMHLGFQEYLAASELRRCAFEEDKAEVVQKLAVHYGESWWQEVFLILLALDNPSLFVPFMREVVKQSAFAAETGLMELILEEAAEVSALPFMELLAQDPGNNQELWGRQERALRIAERLVTEETLSVVKRRMRHHPSPAIQRWLSGSKAATGQEAIQSLNGDIELVRIPAGSFLMGSVDSDSEGFGDERPQHEVTVPSFYLGRYPVTNEEYGRFLAANPDTTEPAHWSDRQFNQARQPVVGVSWEDAKQFAAWAGGRLPTEAEWEYAARAGMRTQWSFGDDEAKLGEYAWYGKNSGDGTHPVGQKNPNPFGLYDVHGNAYEWAEDCWHENYESAPKDGSAWLEADEGNCALRVIRGGSWFYLPVYLRSAIRYRASPPTAATSSVFVLPRTYSPLPFILLPFAGGQGVAPPG